MKISSLEEYGLRVMIHLARNAREDEGVTIPEISDQEGLSEPYVGKLLRLLKRSGLVYAARGRNGGYHLCKHPAEITLTEVLDALGEPLFDSEHCKRFSTASDGSICEHSNNCSVRDIWTTLSYMIRKILNHITLEQVSVLKKDERLHVQEIVQEILEKHEA